MSQAATTPVPAQKPHSKRLALLLAAAMFVLVVDTSLMNVSISAVVEDLDTTASGVQSAIALEALVSAAFILISSKVGDLIGRKRAYVLGLLAYAIGAAGDDPGPEPDGDHHLLGDHRRPGRVVAAAGHAVAHPRELRRRRPEEDLCPGGGRGRDRRRRRATARRVRHDLPVVAGRVRPRGRDHRGRARQHQDGPGRGLHGTSPHRPGRRVALPSSGMGGVVLGILVWQEGGEFVGALIAVGVVGLVCAGVLAGAPQAPGEADVDRPGPVRASRTSGSGSPSRCCSRSPWAAR